MPTRPQPPASLARSARRAKLGELLIELGYLKPAQLEGAMAHQRQWGVSFGRVAVARGFCTEKQVLEALCRQLGLASVDLDTTPVDPRAAERLDAAAAQRLHAIPFRLEGARDEELQVAFAAPAALDVQDEVRSLTGKARVRAFLAGDDAIERAIGRFYRHEPSVTGTPARRQEATGQVREPGAEVLESLKLSPKCLEVVRQAAKDNRVTPEDVLRRVVEAWAAPFARR